MTLSQISKGYRCRWKRKNRTPALRRCPQKKGHVEKLVIKSPKKPHSARRKTARILLFSTLQRVYGYITSSGHSLRRYSNVLIRGGRRRDIPGMRYTMIRGKYDFHGPIKREKARSKYGLKFFR
jgi:small subunit ribosomal protein S12